jgi:coenzyme F420-reducing hydrogenase alpha subunit
MSKRILIDPVTRIEGHAKISIHLDDAGNVSDAEFHVVEFRGFEKFCEGRPLGEMPGITPRICGICPVSHLLASAKAGDAILAVNIPPAADKLRRLMNLGQIVQSHALSFFHLSAPDFLLGWDTRRRSAMSSGWPRPIPTWRAPASGCGSLARKSSRFSEAKKFIPPGPCRAECAVH